MSFQNYENFPSQQGGQDPAGAGPGAPPQQDAQMGGQMPGGAGAQYEGGNGGQPGSAGGQSQEGDNKTTLWYAILSPQKCPEPQGKSSVGFLDVFLYKRQSSGRSTP